MFNTKKYKLFLIIIGAAAQLFVINNMIMTHENVLKNGTLYKIKTEPIDPYDPFRGKYVHLKVDNQIELAAPSIYVEKDTVYAIFTVDDAHFIEFSSIQRKKPAHHRYIKTKIKTIYTPHKKTQEVRLDLPFQRFYLEEHIAPKAERAYQDLSQSDKVSAHINFKVLNGRAVLEDLFIKGIPVSDYIKIRQTVTP